jgi:hypothetical protein
MRIIEPSSQWSPYPTGRNAIERMKSIDHDASFFMEIEPGDAPTFGPNTRRDDAERAFFEKELALCNPSLKAWHELKTPTDLTRPAYEQIPANYRIGETIPMRHSVPTIETCAPNAREWLESDGIPEAIGDTDEEDTKPAAPRNSTPVLPERESDRALRGCIEDRERYPGRSLAW